MPQEWAAYSFDYPVVYLNQLSNCPLQQSENVIDLISKHLFRVYQKPLIQGCNIHIYI